MTEDELSAVYKYFGEFTIGVTMLIDHLDHTFLNVVAFYFIYSIRELYDDYSTFKQIFNLFHHAVLSNRLGNFLLHTKQEPDF